MTVFAKLAVFSWTNLILISLSHDISFDIYFINFINVVITFLPSYYSY